MRSWNNERLSVFIPAGVLVLGLWLPWATVTFGGSAALTANGMQIGSDIFNIPIGWIAAAGGVIAALGALRYEGVTIIFGGIVAGITVGYAIAAIPGKEVAVASGGVELGDLGDLLQVEYAWGVFVLASAVIAVLTAGVRAQRHAMAGWPDS